MKIRFALIGNEYREFAYGSFQQLKPEKYEIVYLLNDDMEEADTECYGIKIISLDQLCKVYRIQVDAVFIVNSWNHYIENAIQKLQEKEIWQIYLPKLYALEKKLPLWNAKGMVCENMIHLGEHEPFCVHLETHVLDDCNLNCKACNNFSPFAERGHKASAEQLKKDLEKIKELFSGIGRFFLLGGEPLLDESLTGQFLQISRQALPDTEIRLLTNGLLIPAMSDDFWNLVRENNIIIHISAYPPTMKILNQIQDILNMQKVEWLIFHVVESFCKHWTEYPFEDENVSNEMCRSAGCHYLRNGKLAKCPDSILIRMFDDAYKTSLYKHDEIDIYGEKNAWEIQRRLIEPCQLCKCCTFDRMEVIPWEAVGKAPKKEDWIVEHRYEYLLRQGEQQHEQLEMVIQTKESMNAELEKKLCVEQASKQEKEMQLLAMQSEKKRLAAEYEEKMRQLSVSRDEKKMQISSIRKEQKKLELELQSVYASHSWRITHILRKSKSVLEHLYKIRKG